MMSPSRFVFSSPPLLRLCRRIVSMAMQVKCKQKSIIFVVIQFNSSLYARNNEISVMWLQSINS